MIWVVGGRTFTSPSEKPTTHSDIDPDKNHSLLLFSACFYFQTSFHGWAGESLVCREEKGKEEMRVFTALEQKLTHPHSVSGINKLKRFISLSEFGVLTWTCSPLVLFFSPGFCLLLWRLLVLALVTTDLFIYRKNFHFSFSRFIISLTAQGLCSPDEKFVWMINELQTFRQKSDRLNTLSHFICNVNLSFLKLHSAILQETADFSL